VWYNKISEVKDGLEKDMRKMAVVKRIDKITLHPNADRLEIAQIGGWHSVIRKGEFKEGDLAIYCEIDSWMPQELAPFLIKDEAKEFNGVRGVRLKSARIRGVLSQGMILPITVINPRMDELGEHLDHAEGFDCSELLNIQKWEPPAPKGSSSSPFPHFIPKTDQERVQNIPREVLAGYPSETFEITEKLDGSSMTVFVNGDQEGVCSRNLTVEGDNIFRETAENNAVIAGIRLTGRNLAVQGELIGESIQGNPYRILGHRFYVFDIFDIDQGRYIKPDERRALTEQMGLRHVPAIDHEAFLPEGVEGILSIADGKSALNCVVDREGVVFKSNESPFTFKAISNSWLLGTGK